MIDSFFKRKRTDDEASNKAPKVVSWQPIIDKEKAKSYYATLTKFLDKERAEHTVFPPPDKVFAALDLTPLDSVKVVIVGQDPYHGPGQANGLAFSIDPAADCKFPPSLANILKEVGTSKHGDLSPWAKQGVLLLNTCLTVRQGKANSHQKKGWETFTDAIVAAVNARPGNGVVFLLWGKPAANKCHNINTKRHRIIHTSHPSPLSNTKGPAPFTGSDCFAKCNSLLVDELGYDAPVDWTLP